MKNPAGSGQRPVRVDKLARVRPLNIGRAIRPRREVHAPALKVRQILVQIPLLAQRLVVLLVVEEVDDGDEQGIVMRLAQEGEAHLPRFPIAQGQYLVYIKEGTKIFSASP